MVDIMFNFSNFTSGVIDWFLDPFKTYLGEFAYPVLFVSVFVVALGVSRNLGVAVAVLLVTFGLFGSTDAFNTAPEFSLFFSIIAVIGITALVLMLFIKREAFEY